MSRKVIGVFEAVGFPEFGVANVSAKIDTGAYTGALHCEHIEETEREGVPVLVFRPLDGTKEITKAEFLVKHVKSSNGDGQTRYFITTDIELHGNVLPILLSLTDRRDMKWPLLIGRRFLQQNNFVVDPRILNGYGGRAVNKAGKKK
jgi:hypothetical protein